MDCCKWKIWEVLTASKANSLSLLMLAKKSQCAQRPFVTHIFLSRQHGIQVATFCHHFLKHIFILQSTDFHFVSFHVVLQITVSHLHCKKEGIKCTRKNKKKSRVVVSIIKLICLFVCFFSCGYYSIQALNHQFWQVWFSYTQHIFKINVTFHFPLEISLDCCQAKSLA